MIKPGCILYSLVFLCYINTVITYAFTGQFVIAGGTAACGGSAVRIRHNSHYRVYSFCISRDAHAVINLHTPGKGSKGGVPLCLFACGKKAYFITVKLTERGTHK